ncbi:hypothetical protein DW355_14780 [Hylemonella gracilis]|uniref:Uncharacterized protein n=1 Tax=Hylemonella gracilis TaxID=80880 RepID=A0A4P6UNI4_9BURK|nr:hypothetical protein DW355_14780 [Hylemonella gracilis]
MIKTGLRMGLPRDAIHDKAAGCNSLAIFDAAREKTMTSAPPAHHAGAIRVDLLFCRAVAPTGFTKMPRYRHQSEM